MWTRKSAYVFIYIKINRFGLPLIIPIRIFWECVDALEDLLLFTGRYIAGKDIRKAVKSVSQAVWMMASLGNFDLVEVEAGSKVKVKICLR